MRSLTRTAAVAVPAATAAPLNEAEIWSNLGSYAEQARGAFADNTARAMRSDIAQYLTWCRQENRQAVPASPETVAAYVDAAATSKATATVRRYISSIASYHRAAEVPNPCESQAVKLALRRMHNVKGRVQLQATPLNEGAVRRLLDARGSATKRGNPVIDLRVGPRSC